MQRLSYRIRVSCLLGISLVNASNVTTTSPSSTISPTLDTPTSSSVPLSSPNPIRNETLDCSNTLHLVKHGDSDLSSCEDDSVSCSSDPIVAANCCKCKPRCCNQCSTPSGNPEDLDICSSTTTTEIEDDKEEQKKKLTGMIGYVLVLVILVICAVSQRSSVPSKEQQQKRRKKMPTKFYIATIPSAADAKDGDTGVANVQSLFEDQKGTLKNTTVDDCEDQANEMIADIKLDDTRHDEGDGNNKTSSKITAAAGDIEDQAGEVMYDIPLGTSSSTDDERIGAEASSEMIECSTSEEDGNQSQLALHDDDDHEVIIDGGEAIISLSERTTSASAEECPICLEPYRPGDKICVSKSPHCNHIFHRECITAWISEHNLCPLCRVDLMTSKRHDKSKAKGKQ
eukprot:scaffold7051_cov79-Cylindrotheca_fusiformis.AAC.2